MRQLQLCVVKMSSLGDILQVAYVIGHLKQHRDDVFVTWIVEKKFQDLVQSLGFIDAIITFDSTYFKTNFSLAIKQIKHLYLNLKYLTFDYVIDFQGNCKSALVTFMCKSKVKVGFDKTSVAEFPSLFVTNLKVPVDINAPIVEQHFTLVKQVFLNLPPFDLTPKNFDSSYRSVMVCFGSNWNNKKLDLNELQSCLEQMHLIYGSKFLIVVGSSSDLEQAKLLQKHLPERVEIYEKPSWTYWMKLMAQVNLVISSDSCALHLAGFLHVPTLSYFGPSSSKIFKPLGSYHFSVQGVCPYDEVFIKRCKKLRSCPTGACIKGITSKNLFEQLP